LNNKIKNKLIALTVCYGIGMLSSGLVYAAEPLVSLKEMVEKVVTSNPEVQARYHKFLESGYEQQVMRG